ncbi:alpha/beta fold hydrolase [Neorhizobium sp. T25_27]|uniref:alpha/beta fold hydrolase n=1 Tax=Neorhizobium sp. T25_27 TaxID=2093831 RepID=UPI001FE0BF56|nr:alpha/beta hydrolase [Neorhizobium sp. T25_27]
MNTELHALAAFSSVGDADLMNRRSLVLGGLVAVAAVASPFEVVATEKSGEKMWPGVLRQIDAGVLNIGFYESGSTDAPTVFLLHGFPYDIHSYLEVAPLLVQRGFHVVIPHLRGHGTTTFLDPSTSRSGQQAAIGKDLVDLMDALEIDQAIFAGYDWGGRAACVAAALWPERCKGLVSVNSYLIQDIARSSEPAPANVERGFWYQFYLQTERGRRGLERHRADIARIMWRDNSPTWAFDDATFARSTTSFENPDYVDVVVHSYRHRLGGAAGYPEYAALELALAAQPQIRVPTVTLDGDSDGVVAATDGTATASRFSGRRVHHVIRGVGHNLPQEAPSEFADAIVEVSRM